MILLLSCVGGNPSLMAETGSGVPPGMTQEQLEKEVQRRFSYVKERLLAGRLAKAIEEGDSLQAKAIFEQSKERMAEIEQWIREGRLPDAYVALQEVSRAMRKASQLARARERKAKRLRDELEEARIVNDAYFERVQKRGATRVTGEVADLIEEARKEREKGVNMMEAGEHLKARTAFESSTRLLKKAMALFKESRQ